MPTFQNIYIPTIPDTFETVPSTDYYNMLWHHANKDSTIYRYDNKEFSIQWKYVIKLFHYMCVKSMQSKFIVINYKS